MAARRSERVTTTRETRVTSRIAEPGDEVAVEPKAGLGLGEAMGIVTFLLLLTAIILVDMHLGREYAEGVFFKP